jgi:hypothetical protein
MSRGRGRPKGSSKPAWLKEWAEKKGLPKLLALAEGKGFSEFREGRRILSVGPDYSIQFEAIRLALAYAIGKPRETIDMVRSVSPEDSKLRAEQVYKIIKDLENETGNAPGSDSPGVADRAIEV